MSMFFIFISQRSIDGSFLTSTQKPSYDRRQDAYIDVFHCHITTIDYRKFFWQVPKTDHITAYKTHISMFFLVISLLSILGSFFDKYTKTIISLFIRRIYRCFSLSYHYYRFSKVFFWQVQITDHMTDYKTPLPSKHFSASGKEQNCYILKKQLPKVCVFTH